MTSQHTSHPAPLTPETVIARALVPYSRMPSEVEVATITDQLLTHGAAAVAAIEALDRAAQARLAGVVRDWRNLVATGPTGSTAGFANWTYSRALARGVRALRGGLRDAGHP